MRHGSVVALLVAVLMVAASACGAVSSLVPGLGGSSATSVDALWPDVPQVPGSERVDTDLPLPARLLLEAYVAAGNAQAESGDFRPEDGDFVVYQLARPGTDLAEHYSPEIMSDNGWSTADGSCGTSPVAGVGVGGLCAFQKTTDTGSGEFLLVILLPDSPEAGQEQVAYVRFSGTTAP